MSLRSAISCAIGLLLKFPVEPVACLPVVPHRLRSDIFPDLNGHISARSGTRPADMII